MLGPQRLLLRRQHAPQQRLRLGRLVPHPEKVGQLGEALHHFGVFGTKGFFLDHEGLTIERLRLAVLAALFAVSRCQIVHGRGFSQVLFAESFRFLERVLEQRFGLVRTAPLQRRIAGIGLLDERGTGIGKSYDLFKRTTQPVRCHNTLPYGKRWAERRDASRNANS
jgi:hypothetical protein